MRLATVAHVLPNHRAQLRLRHLVRAILMLTSLTLTAACPARMAVNAAGNVAGAAVKTTGAVVGGTIQVLTFAEDAHFSPDPSEAPR